MSTNRHVESYDAPAAANYAEFIGYMVYESGDNEVTLVTDATSQRPIGIITEAEDRLGGRVAVCIHGQCKAVAGDVITPGTHVWLSCDGLVDARALPTNIGRYVVGFSLASVATVADEMFDIFVAPQLNPTV